MMSGSLEKASLPGYFRAFPVGFPSFCFQWGCSLGISSMLAAFSSSCLRAGTPWSEEWCQHFLHACSAGVGGASTDPLSAMAHSWMVADIPRMVAKGTIPVKICKGYRSSPWYLGRQAHTAVPKASSKAWWSHPSSTFASHSNASTLPLWAYWRAQAMLWQWSSASLMISVAWVSFRHAASSVLSSSSLWQKSMVVLFVSNHSGAMFIFSCNLRRSSKKLAALPLEGARGLVEKERLTICGVFGRVSWDIQGVMWAKLRAPAGMGTCGDICIMIRIVVVRVAVGTEVTGSVPSGLKGSSDSSAAGRAPRAAEGGCLIGVLCWETEAGVMGEACCSHPMAPKSCRLIAAVMSLDSSAVFAGGGRTGLEGRAWMVVVMPSACMPTSSNAISCSLQMGLPGMAVFQRGNSLKVDCILPSGHWGLLDTPPCPYTVEVYTFRAGGVNCEGPWRGVLSIMALMCPMLDRGACDRTSFNWMKTCTQSVLLSMSSRSLHTTSARYV